MKPVVSRQITAPAVAPWRRDTTEGSRPGLPHPWKIPALLPLLLLASACSSPPSRTSVALLDSQTRAACDAMLGHGWRHAAAPGISRELIDMARLDPPPEAVLWYAGQPAPVPPASAAGRPMAAASPRMRSTSSPSTAETTGPISPARAAGRHAREPRVARRACERVRPAGASRTALTAPADPHLADLPFAAVSRIRRP